MFGVTWTQGLTHFLIKAPFQPLGRENCAVCHAFGLSLPAALLHDTRRKTAKPFRCHFCAHSNKAWDPVHRTPPNPRCCEINFNKLFKWSSNTPFLRDMLREFDRAVRPRCWGRDVPGPVLLVRPGCEANGRVGDKERTKAKGLPRLSQFAKVYWILTSASNRILCVKWLVCCKLRAPGKKFSRRKKQWGFADV